MKFAEHLGSHLTPEWRTQYIEYDLMKKFLYETEGKLPHNEYCSDEVLQQHFAKNDEEFFLFCDNELRKINTFYAEKLAEAVRKFNDLELEITYAGLHNRHQKRELDENKTAENNKGVSDNNKEVKKDTSRQGKRKRNKSALSVSIASRTRKTVGEKKLKELKFALCEFYLSLVLVQNYQQLNFTGFRKILKKHDKVFRTNRGTRYHEQVVKQAAFYINKQINDLITDTETIAIEELEEGDRTRAMKRLRVPPLSEKNNHPKRSFSFGLFTGIFSVILVVIVIAAYCKGEQPHWKTAVRIYRGLFLVFFMIGLLGINIHGWGRGGVNHILIFELDPRHHLHFVDFLNISAFLGVIWGLSCISFLFSKELNTPAYAHPLACVIFYLLFFLNPTKTIYYRARRWLLRILLRILVAPFCTVRFADFWLADQLNSLVVPLRDFQYFLCFYCYGIWNNDDEACVNPRNVIGPLVAILPAWWRFAQCLRRYHDTKKKFPHLVNAGKYSTSMLITIISTLYDIHGSDALFWIWIISLIIGTCYTLAWDIKMDWGLLAKNAGSNRLLREQIVYDYKIYYYLAMLADLIFRFLWTLTVSIGNSEFLHHEFFKIFIAVCEAVRRFIWNFFRLENEHLNNVGEFRAVRDISIKPIESKVDTLTCIELEEGKGRRALKYMTNSIHLQQNMEGLVIPNNFISPQA